MDLREYLTSINVYYKLVLNLYYKLVLNLYYDLHMQDTHDVKCCLLFKISIKHFGGIWTLFSLYSGPKRSKWSKYIFFVIFIQ